tara:strand:- start:4956 stop:5063 length:108 start_codon:yes stop_codon:yes gene_type:complete
METNRQTASLVAANVRFGILTALFVGGLYYIIFKA